MQTYIPRDHHLLSWDPENMETYWRQCEKFDWVSGNSLLKRDELSQKAFQEMFQVKR